MRLKGQGYLKPLRVQRLGEYALLKMTEGAAYRNLQVKLIDFTFNRDRDIYIWKVQSPSGTIYFEPENLLTFQN